MSAWLLSKVLVIGHEFYHKELEFQMAELGRIGLRDVHALALYIMGSKAVSI